jgi:hypothetical protein
MFIICPEGGDNKDVLDMIQITLGFGKVIKQGPRVYRYIVQDKKNLELIVSLFNGNIVFVRRQERFYGRSRGRRQGRQKGARIAIR